MPKWDSHNSRPPGRGGLPHAEIRLLHTPRIPSDAADTLRAPRGAQQGF
ncbi:hypothetical protein K788_0006613 [Paraburkholderia caribensis MBA4]|uniref:Uncharacterized protein n=1 Tax=Paraburkholderia caribensis MBA4 TaxID=1323664 RepID=A0A0P0R846_9BURK|nr:hypothetical protein K788_0006613 [Paraburkholderia caribensis MBA4]